MLTIVKNHPSNKIEKYAIKHDVLGYIFFSNLKASCLDFIKGYEIAKTLYEGN
jgi:hypothetical protein